MLSRCRFVSIWLCVSIQAYSSHIQTCGSPQRLMRYLAAWKIQIATHTHTHTTYTHINTLICTRIHTHTRTRAHTHTHTHTHTHALSHTCTQPPYMKAIFEDAADCETPSLACCTYTHNHTYTQTHLHTHAPPHIHIHTHTISLHAYWQSHFRIHKEFIRGWEWRVATWRRFVAGLALSSLVVPTCLLLSSLTQSCDLDRQRNWGIVWGAKILWYSVAKIRKMRYLCRSFPAKEPNNSWLFCRKWPAT